MERIVQNRIVPVAVIDAVANAVPLARALAQGGLPLIEVTLRTPCALECIRAIRQECPEIWVGAGTILERAMLVAAVEHGAQFGVSPGLNSDVVRAALDLNLPFVPGVITPSEVETALRLGCRLLKYFPADAAGGVMMLKALASAYGATGVRFVPTGGITLANMAAYLAVPAVAAIGGSWLCESRLVKEKKWAEITALTAQAVSKVAGMEPAKG